MANLTIFKMAAVRHVGFWKRAVFIMWPLSAWRSASAHKISPKSDNRSMSYDQNSEFQDGGCRRLEFQNIYFLVTWLLLGSISDVVYQISSKSDNFSLRYGDLTIFKMAAVRHLEFYTFALLSRSPCQHPVLLSLTKFRWHLTIG